MDGTVGLCRGGESLEQAAARELFEETCARVDPQQMQLHMVGNLVRMNQIYMVFRAPLLSPEFSTTEEASEVRLFAADEFPIEDFAFPEVADNVQLFYRDLQRNRFGIYMGTLENGKNTIRVVGRED
ncbi:NUDIX domain-containing protein [Microbulbifer taiwanensis]|uniref:NUDIX domain-containing protein n=1 Tax=Microbulbifer taiwanensis TaxID=986746 RepID=UPI00361BA73F